MHREQSDAKSYFLSVYDEYADAIYRYCLARTSRIPLAEDLTQEVFMRFWQSMRDEKDMQNVRAFLYTIAHNLVIDWYRSRKDKNASLDAMSDESGFEVRDDSSPGTERSAEYREALDALDQLSEEHREVITLRFIEGLDPKDIAERLNVSANVISVRLHRAIDALRTILSTTR